MLAAKMLKKLFVYLSVFSLITVGGYVVMMILNNYKTHSSLMYFIPQTSNNMGAIIITPGTVQQSEQDEEEAAAKDQVDHDKKEGGSVQEEAKSPDMSAEKRDKPDKPEEPKEPEEPEEPKEPGEPGEPGEQKEPGELKEPADTSAQEQGIVKEPDKPCPDMPPNLVGALDVNYNVRHTMEDAVNAAKDFIQEGGRYTPQECIALQKVAIIIPFRKRQEHLKHWLYYLHPILRRQQLDYGVYVINQDGEGTFNRAKLLNVGFVEATKDYDYNCFVFSDVDLVPMNDRNLYRCFDQPRHLAVAMDKFNFHLPYANFFGGVSSLSKDQYLKINGFSNTFWGWGGEDDDLYNRVVARGMHISRPDLLTGKCRMIKHNRDVHNEANPVNPQKLSQTILTMDTDGLNSLTYTVKMVEKHLLYTLITVDINAPNA